MKTIELIHRLSELGLLVERYKNIIFGQKGEVVVGEHFKAEVRKVAGKITRNFDFPRHFHKIDTYDSCYLDLSFDDLFKTLLESASKQEKFFCLSAICQKMGVELESEGV